MYFAGAVPYLRLKREGGALPYFTGAQLYLSGAETVEYSLSQNRVAINVTSVSIISHGEWVVNKFLRYLTHWIESNKSIHYKISKNV